MTDMIDDKLLYLYIPQAEQIALEQYPPVDEPEHSFSKRFNRRMKALFKDERGSPNMRRFVRQFRTAAAVFAIVIITAFATLMTVDATRERIIEFITNSKQSSISVDIYNNEQHNDAPIVIKEPSYVPERILC